MRVIVCALAIVLVTAVVPSVHADPAPTTSAAATPTAGLFLARFATSFAMDAEHRARAHNVALAAEALDNKTIAPGASFSFNDAVGERTAAFGFARAVVLRDGMIAEGVGGGTCQVASTFHAAALMAGLEIVARSPHTRPSAYIRMGLDAAVTYAAIDLKVKNPFRVPVGIRATAAKGSVEVTLHLDAPSEEVPASVNVTSEIVERILPSRTVERDPALDDGAVHVKQYGIPGYRVRRVRSLTFADGRVRRDVRVDLYPPTTEVVRVGPRGLGEAEITSEDGEETETVIAAPARVADPGAVRPLRVQLRPSTLATFDERAR